MVRTFWYVLCFVVVAAVVTFWLLDMSNPLYASYRYSEAGNYSQSIKALDKAIDDKHWLAVNDPRVYLERGWCKINLKDYKGAIADLNKAEQVHRNTNLHNLWTTRGRRQKRFLQTNILFNRGRAHYLSGDWDSALKDYNRALEVEQDTDVLFDRSLALTKKKNYKAALQDLDEIIRLDANNEKAFHQRGYLASQLHQNKAALENLSRAIELKDCNSAYIDRASVYKEVGQLPKALQDLNAAVRIKPDHERAVHERDRVQLAMKNFQAALSDFNKAVELDPSCTEAGKDRTTAQSLLKSAR